MIYQPPAAGNKTTILIWESTGTGTGRRSDPAALTRYHRLISFCLSVKLMKQIYK